MGRWLGLDPGERRIGVALSDPSGTIASPYGFLDVGTELPVAELADLCMVHDVSCIVIGLPLRLDGSEGPAAGRSRDLGAAIADQVGVDIVYRDERFTTVTAEAALIEGNVRRSERKTKRDQVAAAVMLQGHLDAQQRLDRRDIDGRDGDDQRPDR
jgi:putative Holliday junction resolvase